MPGGGKSTDRKRVRLGQAREQATVDGDGSPSGGDRNALEPGGGGGYPTLTVLDATDLCTVTW